MKIKELIESANKIKVTDLANEVKKANKNSKKVYSTVERDISPVDAVFNERLNELEKGGASGGADWDANEGEAGYIENRPFYETIVGNSYSSEEGTGEYIVQNQYIFCKIDENYLSLDELLNRNFSLYNDDYGIDIKEKTSPSNTQDIVGEYVLTIADGSIPAILSVKNGTAIYGTNFETGLYIIKGAIFGSSTPILAKLESQKEIKKISNDFIPTPYSVFIEADTNDFRPGQFKYAAIGENSINFIVNTDSNVYNIKSIISTEEDYNVMEKVEVNGIAADGCFTNIQTLDGDMYSMDANVIFNHNGENLVFVTFTKLLY